MRQSIIITCERRIAVCTAYLGRQPGQSAETAQQTARHMHKSTNKDQPGTHTDIPRFGTCITTTGSNKREKNTGNVTRHTAGSACPHLKDTSVYAKGLPQHEKARDSRHNIRCGHQVYVDLGDQSQVQDEGQVVRLRFVLQGGKHSIVSDGDSHRSHSGTHDCIQSQSTRRAIHHRQSHGRRPPHDDRIQPLL